MNPIDDRGRSGRRCSHNSQQGVRVPPQPPTLLLLLQPSNHLRSPLIFIDENNIGASIGSLMAVRLGMPEALQGVIVNYIQD